MSAHRLNDASDRQPAGPAAPDAAFRGELRSALRRRAIEHGIDPVRVRSLLNTVDQGVADILAGAAFPAVVQRLDATVSTLFPSSPDLARSLLEAATSILMVAAIRAGDALAAQVLDEVLAPPGVPGPDEPLPRVAMPAPGPVDERFLTLIQYGSDIFGIVSRQGQIEYVSRSIERVLGYDPDALHGTNLVDLAGPNDRAPLALAFRTALEHPQQPRRIGATLLHRDGTPRWMEIDLTNLDDVDGRSGIVVSARDATTRKSAEEHLQRLAYFDSLTGLPNRVQFRERLDAALDAGATSSLTTGVIFIDLDRFKAINDRFGHDGGDTALVAVGERLTSAVQPGDLAARYGGEEFAILLVDTSPERAMRVAKRVIRAVATAFPGHGASGTLSASAGVALRSDGMDSSQELLRAADLALYRSKARGGGVATLYHPGEDTWEDLARPEDRES